MQEISETNEPLLIDAKLASKIGFASQQNAVPLLQKLEITNNGDTTFNDLCIELSANPPVCSPKTWRIDRLRPQDSIQVPDRDVRLDPNYLADLVESVRAEITLKVQHDGQNLRTQHFPLEVLANSEWGGFHSMPELLAAFCQPNDPSVDRILKSASDILRRAGKKDAINGYADTASGRTRPWELTAALWSAVCALQLRYAMPPASFETQGQKIRSPSSIMDGGIATCLDTALLFAAAIEQAGLNPVLVLTQGHAFVGAWLQPQEFAQIITEDPAAVRKRIDLQELCVFETTLATQAPAPAFSQAVDAAKRQLAEEHEDKFVMALDIRRARMQKIRPLALVSAARLGFAPTDTATDAPLATHEALEEAPLLPSFDVDLPSTIDPQTGKLELWQRKLLDLTTRNRLLHLPDSAKGIRLFCPDPAELENQLAKGQAIRIVSPPNLEAGGRDAAIYEQQKHRDLREEYARTALTRGEVLATLDKDKLNSALIDLHRTARTDMDEGGANTLFLGIGFLKWKKTPDDAKSYLAPLVMQPVKLDRKNDLSGFNLRILDEEPRFNLTLLELLRHDFALEIDGLDGELAADDSGIDVSAIWAKVRRAVRDIPGFEVTTDLVLSTFSFSKYLMWKDLTARKEQLQQSSLVKHLLQERSERGGGLAAGGDFPRPEEIDQKNTLASLFTPLPTDSSQLAAVIASASGCNFVLDGPPGTGKSQTIANIIAHNLALGRKVLFVAEKMAALNVVHRRLAAQGLGEFCLELHSHKTSKTAVLQQLGRAWNSRATLGPQEWQEEADKVQGLRDKLNALVSVLHERRLNGLSIYEAMGRVVRDGDTTTCVLHWPKGTEHDKANMAALRDVAKRLDLHRSTAQTLAPNFAPLNRSAWSNGWQETLLQTAKALPAQLDTLEALRDQFIRHTNLPLEATQSKAVQQWLDFSKILLQAYDLDMAFAFSPDYPTKAQTMRRVLEVLTQYKSLEGQLSVPYSAQACRKIAFAHIQAEWDKAGTKFWFLATLAQKKVGRELARQGRCQSLPKVTQDLPLLEKMNQYLADLDPIQNQMLGLPGWVAIDSSDLSRMEKALDLSRQINIGIAALATSPNHFQELQQATEKLLIQTNSLLSADGHIALTVKKWEAALEAYTATAQQFEEFSGNPEVTKLDFSQLRSTAIAITEQQAQLRSWCNWCSVREEAERLGLQPLSDALVHDRLPEGAAKAFEVAYARWFATGAMDSEPLLLNFVAHEHMNTIETYRLWDDQLAKLSVRYIRAKLCGLIPDKNEISQPPGFAILKHELQKQRAHKPVRKLAAEMGDSLFKLAPCMLMSPLSIAQYLPADQALFDLVIFDEASQITPWDAIGSIARGKQVIIAGDPKQMPPTNFFNRDTSSGDDDDTEADMESILDECLSAGVPSHSLSWHYRSRHESLIAFSNHRYYDSNLITFPAPETRASAVTWQRVQGVYAKGAGQHNQIEAEAIVAETLKRLTDPAFIAAGYSLGIITLNSKQQQLVNDLLDRARRQRPEIEPFFKGDDPENCPEPVIVKNLETVQGDERDVIILGIGYGPTEPGGQTMSMNFGPLNREGGWRRLNVAISRARREMLVFSSFDPSMLDLNRTKARAVHDLKHFIEFAQQGPAALSRATRGSMGGYDSPFEEAVAQGLSRKGWQVVPQIGVSRFRIDLGIVHPDRPGDYLVGIECDGATYHSAATARDRDKVRAAILKDLGWELLRVWSTDWWTDKAGKLERLHQELEILLEQSRAKIAEQEAKLAAELSIKADHLAVDLALEPAQNLDVPDHQATLKQAEEVIQDEVNPTLRIARPFNFAHTPSTQQHYQITDLSEWNTKTHPNRFHFPGYTPVLCAIIEKIIHQESPILDNVLVQRIARLHDFKRAGNLIQDRILGLVKESYHLQSDPIEGQFIWLNPQAAANWNVYRIPKTEEEARAIKDIAFEELRSAMQSVKTGDDAITATAHLLGTKRISESARNRLMQVQAKMQEKR